MRCDPNSRFGWIGALVVGACAVGFGCHGATDAPQARAAQSTPQPTVETAPHGDHNPHHGGIVFMRGSDLHYEVVLDRSGRSHAVYFSDAVREDLPASLASDVTLTIHRPHESDERIAMRIDDAGESWIGAGRPVESPGDTTVRVAFTIQREPYWIDVPFGR